MKNKLFIIVVLLASVALSFLTARSFRVNQIPNGSKFNCANCHVSPSGGGSRNAFGSEIGLNYLDMNGNVIWNSQIAALDSDGDGFTNGEELQNPDGSWTSGNIGDPELVTNPGDPNSFPNPTNIHEDKFFTVEFALKQNFPNPFNPSTNISFSIPQKTNVKIEIFNTLGKKVDELINRSFSAGEHIVEWNAASNNEEITSGVYFYRMSTENYAETKRMILIK